MPGKIGSVQNGGLFARPCASANQDSATDFEDMLKSASKPKEPQQSQPTAESQKPAPAKGKKKQETAENSTKTPKQDDPDANPKTPTGHDQKTPSTDDDAQAEAAVAKQATDKPTPVKQAQPDATTFALPTGQPNPAQQDGVKAEENATKTPAKPVAVAQVVSKQVETAPDATEQNQQSAQNQSQQKNANDSGDQAASAEVSQQAAKSKKPLVDGIDAPDPDSAPVKAQTTTHNPNPVAHMDTTDSSAVAAADEPPSTTPVSKPTLQDSTPALPAPQPVKTDAHVATPKADVPPPPPTEAQFIDQNHAKILDSIKMQLLPHGGEMQLHLDPPELGAMQVNIEVRDGAIVASFQTSNDQATRVLSHSLDQLRQSLEAGGVAVTKLQVHQAPRDQAGTNQQQEKGQTPQEQSDARQEQQRREMLNRMWRRLSLGSDPLDMVA